MLSFIYQLPTGVHNPSDISTGDTTGTKLNKSQTQHIHFSHEPASFPNCPISIRGTPVHQITKYRNVRFFQAILLSHYPYLDFFPFFFLFSY